MMRIQCDEMVTWCMASWHVDDISMTAKQKQSVESARAPLVIAVCADPAGDEGLARVAARLSVELNLPFLEKPVKRGVDVLVVVTARRLELRMVGGDPLTRGGRPVFADLSKIDVKSAAGKRIGQPIGRAMGLKNMKGARPTVMDCTAGWGEDSWLLAGLGCRVLAVERNPLVAALLRDGLLRATEELPEVAGRVTLLETNAIDLLRRLGRPQEVGARSISGEGELPADLGLFAKPDVVYLDPMFPPRRKGAEGKSMKVLRQLVGDDGDGVGLWEAAMKVARRRVVVKRPLHGDPIGDQRPTSTHKGKSLRYDVYAVL